MGLAEMQRKLLEQMMGPEAMGAVNANLQWFDEKVLTCTTASKMNAADEILENGPGSLSKSHTERLKTDFNEAREKNPSDPRFDQFQREYEANISSFVEECDRRIRAAHRRLEKTPEENAKTTNLMREIGEIELAIQGGTEKIESLGGQGRRVHEGIGGVEALKAEKTEKERELQQLTDTSGASGHQKLRVCDVCGAYLSVLDSDRRLADHFGGKMHLGYFELRKMLDELKQRRSQGGRGPMGPPPVPASAPSGPGASAPDGPRDRGYDRDRDRDRDRDHRDGHRDRDRDHHSSRYDETVIANTVTETPGEATEIGLVLLGVATNPASCLVA
ncbi:hypothetical protein RHS01_02351 [Rhizoctonia solani]|uniref:U1 snRNP-associated protein usp106 n=1 Tax=Rhizoctonia solani TaxID=456999 RepID=A0A8H7M921_9AGAM|nr:hypothetical protein RHS01_02351 [Rhizoctonia solani]